jgi:hypothetical protein
MAMVIEQSPPRRRRPKPVTVVWTDLSGVSTREEHPEPLEGWERFRELRRTSGVASVELLASSGTSSIASWRLRSDPR